MTVLEQVIIGYVVVDFVAACVVGAVIYRNRYALASRLRTAIRNLFDVDVNSARLAEIEEKLSYFENRRRVLDIDKGIDVEAMENSIIDESYDEDCEDCEHCDCCEE